MFCRVINIGLPFLSGGAHNGTTGQEKKINFGICASISPPTLISACHQWMVPTSTGYIQRLSRAEPTPKKWPMMVQTVHWWPMIHQFVWVSSKLIQAEFVNRWTRHAFVLMPFPCHLDSLSPFDGPWWIDGSYSPKPLTTRVSFPKPRWWRLYAHCMQWIEQYNIWAYVWHCGIRVSILDF